MKKIIKLVLSLLITSSMNAQNFTYPSGIKYTPPSSGQATIIYDNPIDYGKIEDYTQPPLIYDQGIEPINYNNINQTKSITPVIGRNFGANNLGINQTYKLSPPDNNIAISNAGKIFSVDNYAADVYSENEDTITQFLNKWSLFHLYSGFTFSNTGFFDPRCIYDKHKDRFINIILNKGSNFSNSKLLISFSQGNDPDLFWNFYEIKADSLYHGMNYWFDYPSIAINKDELYITLNVFDTNKVFKDNILLQIDKNKGYTNDTLVWDYFKSIKNTSNQVKVDLLPLSDAMQDSSYNNGVFLVQTRNLSSGHDSLYWYKLTGNLTDTNRLIIPHSLQTSTYKYFNYASQPGGNAGDRISIKARCSAQSGYYQNGKLHFVYVRSNNAWGQIVYSKIDTLTNSEQRATYGNGNPNNYCYPSIAHFGYADTTENAMICFLKVGLTTYPSIGVINYDGNWSNETIVKQGDSLLNLLNYTGETDSYERWGDYTCIQRKYNNSQPTVWLVGSYSFGNTPNLGNITYGLNAWIAEIGDVGVGVNELEINKKEISIFPNPSDNIIKVNFDNSYNKNTSIKIFNQLGEIVFQKKQQKII